MAYTRYSIYAVGRSKSCIIIFTVCATDNVEFSAKDVVNAQTINTFKNRLDKHTNTGLKTIKLH